MMEKFIDNQYSFIRNKKGYSVPMWPSFYLYNIDPDDYVNVIGKSLNKELPWQIWIEKEPDNDRIIKYLREQGFKKIGEFTGMAVDINILDNLRERESVRILKVATHEMLIDWVSMVVKEWWGGDDKRVGSVLNVYKELYTSKDVELFVAYYNGTPVGTSLGIFDGDSVGLYMIFTHSDYRNQGIGKLLTLAPLLSGKEKGYKSGVLYATEEGKIIYDQIGFKKVCNSQIYLKD